jgi:hypothetical protein
LSAIDTANRAVERVNSADDACDKHISEGQLGNEGTEVSLVGSGENKNGRCGSRTHDLRIKSQQTKNHKSLQNKPLTENTKNTLSSILSFSMRENPDLLAVVQSWEHLPAHIKAAVLALIQTTFSYDDRKRQKL